MKRLLGATLILVSCVFAAIGAIKFSWGVGAW